MFDFIFSEAWWMETILIAVITGGFTFVASMIGAWAFYNYRLKAIKDDTENLSHDHEGLMAEHKELSKEQRSLSKELGSKVDGAKDQLKVKVDGIRELIVVEQNEQKHRYGNLSGNQKIMVDSINNLKEFAKEMEKLQFENMQLKSENQLLKQQINQRSAMREEDWEPEI